MSLIRVRRDRKAGMQGGPTRPPSMKKLLAALVLVAFAMWYLSRLG